MKILLLGSGGRENALAWHIAKSQKLTSLFIAPGNAGTEDFGKNVPLNITDFEEIKRFVVENKIDMVVAGSEESLVKGIHDYFLADKMLKKTFVVGPCKNAALLEGSKDFAKKFMSRYKIPTAEHATFSSPSILEGMEFLKTLPPPFVLKADGLAAGKGVLIVNTLSEAITILKEMLGGKFGEASRKVVVERYLEGMELSVFVATDGKNYKLLPSAKDYKRIGEGDSGLNTGGMGAISPVHFANKEFLQKVQERIVEPTLKGLQNEGILYQGFLFLGLMNVKGNPYVIEYNVRLGDPETEVILPLLKSDFLEMCEAIKNGTLDSYHLEIDSRVAATVMLVSRGYPKDYNSGKIVRHLEEVSDCYVFHAGTKKENNEIRTNGGRVFSITGVAPTLEEALQKCYKNAAIIDFDGKYYRRDIGFDLKK